MAVAVQEPWRAPGIEVGEYLCTLGPADRSFEEQHCGTCVAFVRAGGFAYRSALGSASLGAGAVLLGNAGHAYTCAHHVPGGDRCLSFIYAPEIVDEVAGAAGVRREFARPSLPASTDFAALPALAASAIAGRGPSLEELAYEVLARALAADAGRPIPQPPASEQRRAIESMRFIDERAAEPLTLRRVAAQARLSPFHFLRAFRRSAGTTPHQYLLAARVRRGAALLLETDLPVTEVAGQAGFGDLSNFIRTFRRGTGLSPRAFRKRRR